MYFDYKNIFSLLKLVFIKIFILNYVEIIYIIYMF